MRLRATLHRVVRPGRLVALLLYAQRGVVRPGRRMAALAQRPQVGGRLRRGDRAAAHRIMRSRWHMITAAQQRGRTSASGSPARTRRCPLIRLRMASVMSVSSFSSFQRVQERYKSGSEFPHSRAALPGVRRFIAACFWRGEKKAAMNRRTPKTPFAERKVTRVSPAARTPAGGAFRGIRPRLPLAGPQARLQAADRQPR